MASSPAASTRCRKRLLLSFSADARSSDDVIAFLKAVGSLGGANRRRIYCTCEWGVPVHAWVQQVHHGTRLDLHQRAASRGWHHARLGLSLDQADGVAVAFGKSEYVCCQQELQDSTVAVSYMYL